MHYIRGKLKLNSMSTQATIKRYTLIVEKVSSVRNPSIKEIKDYLEDHGLEISDRTLQRDIEQIRYEFGIDIVYDRLNKGYSINKEESINIDSFLKFLEIVGTANLLSDSLKEGKDTLNYLSFESQGNLKGVDNLKDLLFAIKNKRFISFVHQNFSSETSKAYRIRPGLLKEYRGRWYVVGYLNKSNDVRTFGVDRLENLKIEPETFTQSKKQNLAALFEYVVGLNYSAHSIKERVTLSVTPIQARYLKALPLHPSQYISKETDKEVFISLNVIPNYELTQQLMMLGENVKVIEPKWLADEMIELLKTALKRYKK